MGLMMALRITPMNLAPIKIFKCEPYKNKDFKRFNQLSQNNIILDYLAGL